MSPVVQVLMIKCSCALPAAPIENGPLRALIHMQGLVQVVLLYRIHEIVLHILLMVDALEIRIVDTHIIVENCA